MFSRARTEKDCVCDVHERTCLAELLKPTISFSYLKGDLFHNLCIFMKHIFLFVRIRLLFYIPMTN